MFITSVILNKNKYSPFKTYFMKTLNELKQLNSAQLVQLVMLNGNELAFAALRENTSAMVKRKIKSFLHDNRFVDDMHQEAFVKAHIRLSNGEYDCKISFEAWITAVVTNQCINFLKNSRQKYTRPLNHVPEHALDLYDTEQEEETAAAKQEREKLVKAMAHMLLDEMNPDMKEIVRLKATGLAEPEISDKMGIHLYRVKYLSKKIKKIGGRARVMRNSIMTGQPLPPAACAALKLPGTIAA